MMLPDITIEKIITVLKKDTRVAAAYLFGSAAKGELRPDSDIDIAILPVPKIFLTQMDLLKLSSQLEDHCGREVDIGILSSKNLIYTKEAILNGKCIYEKDDIYCRLFVATALGLYAQLKKERKEVEDAYISG
ncbi:MAG: nucleotidyltransferase domain-containing protein [Desulfobacteraceae bacterium]|jgi:predicted nucleotidyltransferase|nr:nucleotidyltransferase domain-containing protein [Desulfobacteraceae bacterium]